MNNRGEERSCWITVFGSTFINAMNSCILNTPFLPFASMPNH
jgi:hypothetical protein